MPNHIQNRVFYSGDPVQIRQMLSQIQNDEFSIGTIDFDKIIPMPEDVQDTYDWHKAQWDTKWKAYGYQRCADYSQAETLDFWTANTAPHAVIFQLSSMFPDIAFTHEWADEDIGSNCGKRAYQDGEQMEEYYPDTDTERIEFACSVWGCTPQDMGYAFDEDTQSYYYYNEEMNGQSAT